MSLADLRAAAYLGFLKPDDLVRDPHSRMWMEAYALPSLSDVFPTDHSKQGPDPPAGALELGPA